MDLLLKQKRVLRVGIDDAPPIPLQMGDPSLGTFRGYEVDLLEHVASRLDCRLHYRRALWSVITEELVSGRLDLVCSAATVTEDRKEKVSFGEPHLQLKLASVVRHSMPDGHFNKEASRFGVRRGTTAEEFLRSTINQEPAISSESNDELYAALSRGELDAVIDDSPIALHFANTIEGLRYQGAYEGTSAAYAMMFAKDNDALKREINALLLNLETEGVLARMRSHWFKTPTMLIA